MPNSKCCDYCEQKELVLLCAPNQGKYNLRAPDKCKYKVANAACKMCRTVILIGLFSCKDLKVYRTDGHSFESGEEVQEGDARLAGLRDVTHRFREMLDV
jgi:hypothetical protein